MLFVGLLEGTGRDLFIRNLSPCFRIKINEYFSR
jgi:hypothetical protein